jgi:hypothetical protein
MRCLLLLLLLPLLSAKVKAGCKVQGGVVCLSLNVYFLCVLVLCS